MIGSPRGRRPKASQGGNRRTEGLRLLRARYGDLKAGVSAGRYLFRALALGAADLRDGPEAF